MPKIAIVIRHLPNNRPVTLAVIAEPKHTVNDLEHFFNSQAEEIIDKFKEKFVEFKNANFYTDIKEIY